MTSGKWYSIEHDMRMRACIVLFMHSPMQRKYAAKAAHGARGE